MAGPKDKKADPKPVVEAVAPKLHPMKVLKDYRPKVGMDFKIMENTSNDDEPNWEVRDPEGTQEVLEDNETVTVASLDYAKVKAGSVICLPKEEAQRLYKAKVIDAFSEIFDG